MNYLLTYLWLALAALCIGMAAKHWPKKPEPQITQQGEWLSFPVNMTFPPNKDMTMRLWSEHGRLMLSVKFDGESETWYFEADTQKP